MKRGYSENANGDVVLTMSPDDYHGLLIALIYATGMVGGDPMLKLVNRLNEGNLNFTPYGTRNPK